MDICDIADRCHVWQGNGGATNNGRAASATAYIGLAGAATKSNAEPRADRTNLFIRVLCIIHLQDVRVNCLVLC